MTTPALTINLVTPEKLYLSEDVHIVVAPGMLGDFGALAGHAPLVSLLRPGIIDITLKDGENKKIFVASGFVEINDKGCTILAEEVFALSELNADAIQKDIEKLSIEIQHANNEKESDRLSAKRELEEIKLLHARKA